MAKVRVTRNYQVTIPSKVREELDIKEGDYILIEPHGKDRAILKKIIPIESLAGAWDDEMDRIMEEVQRHMEGLEALKSMHKHGNESRVNRK